MPTDPTPEAMEKAREIVHSCNTRGMTLAQLTEIGTAIARAIDEARKVPDAADAELGRMVRAMYEKCGDFCAVRLIGKVELDGRVYVANTLDEAVRKALEAK